MIYRNAFLSVGGVDLSSFVQSLEPSFEVEMQDDTAMGATSRSNDPGLENWSFNVTFVNPFDENGPDATIWPLKGTKFAVIFRPDAGAASATNPQYSGQASIGQWTPVAGSVGDEAIGTLDLVAGGDLGRGTGA
jgi:hypothetical protein